MSILRQFWQAEEVPDAVRALEMEAWMDVLEPLAEDEIRAAWAEYQRQGPRSAKGALYRPDAGALYRLAMQARGIAAGQKVVAAREKARHDEARAYAARQAARPSWARAGEIVKQVFGGDNV